MPYNAVNLNYKTVFLRVLYESAYLYFIFYANFIQGINYYTVAGFVDFNFADFGKHFVELLLFERRFKYAELYVGCVVFKKFKQLKPRFVVFYIVGNNVKHYEISLLFRIFIYCLLYHDYFLIRI